MSVGNFVVLVSTTDPYTNLEPGDVGVIRGVDSLGTRHVQWLTRPSNLGLVPGEDQWEEYTPGEALEQIAIRDRLADTVPTSYTIEQVKRELGLETDDEPEPTALAWTPQEEMERGAQEFKERWPDKWEAWLKWSEEQ